jgi:hypothetical protein
MKRYCIASLILIFTMSIYALAVAEQQAGEMSLIPEPTRRMHSLSATGSAQRRPTGSRGERQSPRSLARELSSHGPSTSWWLPITGWRWVR